MKTSRLLTGLLLACAAAPALAQGKPPPLPPEGKRWIEGFIGTAKSTDLKMTMGNRAATGAMTVTCTRAAGGRAAQCKARITTKGMPPEDDAFLMGWNAATGEAHLFEVTSDGEVHDHAGKWSDDRTITVVHRGKNARGQDAEDSLTFTWVSAKKMEVKGEGK